MATPVLRPYIRPIEETQPTVLLLGVLLASATACWLFYCLRLLTEGHFLLGTTSYGATWGITVANVVHIIGISHVGVAISATVRLLRLERYRNVARLAELVTLVALVTAVINIALDVGRPERFIVETLLYGKWYAPMVWSMTVITLYLLASFVYLYLSMRRDLRTLSETGLKLRKVYGFLALGYQDTLAERARHEHTLYWLGIVLLPLMISVHSVYGLIFGLLSAKAGWFNPLQAPYFVLGAIVSGFSAIIVIAAVLRRTFAWQELLSDRIFKVFGSILAFVVFLYLYFLFSEQFTAQHSLLPAEKAVSQALLSGSYSAIFWPTILCGLLLPFVYLFLQGIRRDFVHVGWTAVAALLVNVAMWLKRFLIVVPPQYQNHLPLPRPPVLYSPTVTEIVVTLGSYAFAGLFFLLILKTIPVVELPAKEAIVASAKRRSRSWARGLLMTLTLIAGVFLTVWGITTRHYDLAPLKWLSGMALLVVIPLERCLLGDSK